jgi:propionyl-CoA carboxylase alpha chain
MHLTLARRAQEAGGSAPGLSRRDWRVVIDQGLARSMALELTADGLVLQDVSEGRALRLSEVNWRPGGAQFRGCLDGAAFTAEVHPALEGFWIRHRAVRARVLVLTPLSAELHDRLPRREAADTSKLIVSPMPGLVVALDLIAGQEIKAGETVAVIEAMKMQNIIKADRDGRVLSVNVKSGDSVAADEVLVELA